jgi:hypothetical protein
MPTSLSALGGYAQILLQWTAPSDTIRAYFEVWRSATSNLGQAVKIGQTTSWTFADSVQNGATYWYWVRAVSRFSDTIVSEWSSASGVSASTAPDISYALNVLTGANGEQPFYYQANPTTIDGITIPAGVYLKSLYAYAATVAVFRAGLAVIDNANIISLNADKITAGTMNADRVETNSLVAKMGTFTTGQFGTMFANKAFLTSANINSHLQSDNFNGNPANNDPGTAGWYLGRDGKIYATGGVFSGTVLASSFVGGSFNGGNFSGGTFTGGMINGATVVAGQIRSSQTMGPYFTPQGSRWGSVSGHQHFWNLQAVGTDLALHINGRFRVYADGRTEIDEPVIARSNVIASGSASAINPPLVRWVAPPPPDPGSGGGA